MVEGVITPVVEMVALPDATIWTESSGVVDGVPLVLAHGGPGLSNNLGPVAAMVDDVSRVHRYDQRGCGRSSAGGPFDIATFVADLDALRVHWGHDRWVVGGHSWGAMLSLFYALAHPERTLGIIYLAGTPVDGGTSGRAHEERMRRLTDAERDELRLLSERLREREDARDRARFLRLLWSTDFASPEAAAVLDTQPLYDFPRNEAVFDAIVTDWRQRLGPALIDGIRGLDLPVLVLHGEHDPDPVGALEVADLAPRGEAIVLPGVGHSPWMEDPEAMQAPFRRFIASLA